MIAKYLSVYNDFPTSFSLSTNFKRSFYLIVPLESSFEKLMAAFVSISGLITMIFGILALSGSPQFINPFFRNPLVLGLRDGIAFFSILIGFVIIRVGFSLKNMARRTWRVAFISIIATTAIMFFNGLALFYPTLIGIAINVTVIVMLIRHAKDYTMHSGRIMSPEITAALITIVFTVSYGIGGTLFLGSQFRPHITDLGNAIYYTGETVTTLGFGDILPVTLEAKLFTISLAILGIATFFGAVTAIISPMIEKRIGGIVNIMTKHQMETLDGYVLVLGYSGLISLYIDQMKENGTTVVIVDDESNSIEALRDRGFNVINRKADDEDILFSFNLQRARQIIVSSGNDGYNLMILSSLKESGKVDMKKVNIIVNEHRNRKKFEGENINIIDLAYIIGENLKNSLQ